MEEIKVGEYVRVAGEIRKIIGYKVGEYIEIYHDRGSASYWSKEGITELKHSKNIIDLIEVGDYVNGIEVLDIYKPRDLWEPIELRINDKHINFLIKDDIKSIVTKEMYKNIEYRLE